LVNIDRNEDGSVAERLLVKRAVGFPEEVIRFNEGNVMIRKAGSTTFQTENSFRKENGLSEAPIRSLDEGQYEGIKAWGALYAYQELGVKQTPGYLASAYGTLQNTRYPEDMYQFEAARSRTKTLFDPSDSAARSASAVYQEGLYVGKGQVLPLGDNRDNSRDGRYFGPVWQKNVNGRVLFRFWPLSRISYLGNK
jgi:signal peptidase I